MAFQTDCRFFSGYKPCSLNSSCSEKCEHKKSAEPRILIVHLEALGAVLRGTVILRAIKRKWPNSHITWITNANAVGLLENNPFIDRLLKNDHQGLLALSTLEFDYGFCIDKSLVASGLLRVPKLIYELRGFGTDSKTGAIVPLNIEAKRLYELGLSNHEKFYVNKKPETQLIIESLGLDFQRDEYIFEYTAKEKENLEIEKKKIKKKSIGLNTGCSPTIPYKKLSVQGWVTLIDVLKRDFPRSDIYLLGGPEDALRNQEIHSLRPFTIETPTSQGLRAGFRAMDLCDVVVTGDSLGMHIAIALKKWVVAWFGPTCDHEIDFYDRGVAIKTKAPCSPCWRRECDKPLMCYDQVEWSEVSRAIALGFKEKFVREKNIAAPAKDLPEITL